MEVPDFLKKLFRSDSSVSVSEMIRLRESKIDLIKSEISTLINLIDENEEDFQESKKATDDQIEKGFKGGELLRSRLISKHALAKSNLVKSLRDNKSELRSHERELFKLKNNLQKAKEPQLYSDCIVRGENGAILMLLRRNGDSFEPNKWGLPGGKIEPGEDPADAAKRELYEESHLLVESVDKVAEKVLPDGGKIYYFNAYIRSSPDWIALDEEEHSNYCFMTLNELRQRPKEDFILDLRNTLLEIVDPLHQHYTLIKKAHDNGQIEDDIFSKAMDTMKFTFREVRETHE